MWQKIVISRNPMAGQSTLVTFGDPLVRVDQEFVHVVRNDDPKEKEET